MTPRKKWGTANSGRHYCEICAAAETCQNHGEDCRNNGALLPSTESSALWGKPWMARVKTTTDSRFFLRSEEGGRRKWS